jgi:hypothetical protein
VFFFFLTLFFFFFFFLIIIIYIPAFLHNHQISVLVLSGDSDFNYGFICKSDGGIVILDHHFVMRPGSSYVSSSRDIQLQRDPFARASISDDVDPDVASVTAACMALLEQYTGDFAESMQDALGQTIRRPRDSRLVYAAGVLRVVDGAVPMSPASVLLATLTAVHPTVVNAATVVTRLVAGMLSRSPNGDGQRETLATELGADDERFRASGRRALCDDSLSALALVTHVDAAPVDLTVRDIAGWPSPEARDEALAARAAEAADRAEAELRRRSGLATKMTPAMHAPGRLMETNGLVGLKPHPKITDKHKIAAAKARMEKNGTSQEEIARKIGKIAVYVLVFFFFFFFFFF